MTFHVSEHDALAVVCPFCSAPAGSQCSDKGRPGGYAGPPKPHPARVRRAAYLARDLAQARVELAKATQVAKDEQRAAAPRRRWGRKTRAGYVSPNAIKALGYTCPACGASAGEKCVDQRVVGEKPQVIAKPHRDRILLAAQGKRPVWVVLSAAHANPAFVGVFERQEDALRLAETVPAYFVDQVFLNEPRKTVHWYPNLDTRAAS